MTNWKPTILDIDWTTRNIAMIKDGGIWGVPQTGSTYQLFHSRKQYVYAVGPMSHLHETDDKIQVVLTQLDWRAE